MTIKQRNVSSIDNLATFFFKGLVTVMRKRIVRLVGDGLRAHGNGIYKLGDDDSNNFVELRHSYLYCTNFSRHQRRRRQ